MLIKMCVILCLYLYDNAAVLAGHGDEDRHLQVEVVHPLLGLRHRPLAVDGVVGPQAQ